MALRLEHVDTFAGAADDPIKWPNSAAVFADGRIAVADSGHDRVVVLSADGQILWQAGRQGFGRGCLREPICVFVTPDQHLIVSDWHNHRLVVYTPALELSHTLGHLGQLDQPKGVKGWLRHGLSFLSNLAIDHVGAPYYFTPDKMVDGKPEKPKRSIMMLLKGLVYYALHSVELRRVFLARGSAMMKPNGAVFAGDRMVIAQKGHRCLSEYRLSAGWKDLQLIRHVRSFNNGDSFKRLCNMAQDPSGRIYVCDQKNWRIVVFNPDLSYHSEIVFEDDGRYPDGPFSCVVIGDQYLAVAIGFAVEVRALESGRVEAFLDGFGETHGITWDAARQMLYFVDRSESCLRCVRVDFGGQG